MGCWLASAAAPPASTPPTHSDQPVLQVQQRGQLTPLGDGIAAHADDWRTGDILLSSTRSLVSLGIRAFTWSPVSHAALSVGDGQVVEAVGAGVQQRPLADYLAGESTVAAFRHPEVSADQAQRLQAYTRSVVDQKYNPVGIALQAPFTVQRRYCELPVVPGFVRDLCVRGVGVAAAGVLGGGIHGVRSAQVTAPVAGATGHALALAVGAPSGLVRKRLGTNHRCKPAPTLQIVGDVRAHHTVARGQVVGRV